MYLLKELLSHAKFYEIINQPSTSPQQVLHYSRFRIYFIIARYSELRINQIESLTKSDIN